MKKLLLRLVVNAFGLSILWMLFGWPLLFVPGQNTIYDLERATHTGQELHLMCWEGTARGRQLLAEQRRPQSPAARQLQLDLAGALILQQPGETWVDWKPPALPKDPLMPLLVGGFEVLFFGLLTWIDPIGRLWRAKRWKKLAALVCLSLPGMASMPTYWQDDRLRWQISEVVDQPFQLLWSQREGSRGLVVLLRDHPDHVERRLVRHLHLDPRDRLCVRYVAGQDPLALPPGVGWMWVLFWLGGVWLTHRLCLAHASLFL